MKQFGTLPKSIKKTVRYIRQDADYDKLVEIESVIIRSINQRKQELRNTKDVSAQSEKAIK